MLLVPAIMLDVVFHWPSLLGLELFGDLLHVRGEWFTALDAFLDDEVADEGEWHSGESDAGGGGAFELYREADEIVHGSLRIGRKRMHFFSVPQRRQVAVSRVSVWRVVILHWLQ